MLAMVPDQQRAQIVKLVICVQPNWPILYPIDTLGRTQYRACRKKGAPQYPIKIAPAVIFMKKSDFFELGALYQKR